MNARVISRRWVQPWFDERQSNHMPSLLCTDEGVLIATWNGGLMQWNGDPQARDSAIWLSRLEPGAKEWSVPEGLAMDMRCACHDGHFVRNRTGELIFLFAKWLDTGRNVWTWCGNRDELWTRTSVDGGWSWRPARQTDLPLGTGFPSNDGLLLPNGDLLVAVTSPEVPDRYFGAIRILRSTDDGRTWSREALLVSPDGTKIREPAVASRPDGSILMFTRACPPDLDWGEDGYTGKLVAYRCSSSDGGHTWTEPAPSTIRNNESKIDLIGWSDGTLLMAYDDTANIDWHERSPLWLAASHDEGASWQNLVEIAPSPGNKCQPAMCRGPDGLLHVVYMHRHTAVEHVAIELS